ncbi:hypothetical protein NB704_001251 [Pantoea ananatis]|nr:hypothetical protein [Pantoea ananatis]
MREYHRRHVEAQGAFNQFPEMNFGAVNRAG